ncbi:hypothetical protein ACNUDN_14115 [Mycobacterium sp. smrl_JER01]|uniref:hypothetical protein n=1 Tax=Mycobacterium sp. smrl_JER01 TaxID=3402633 RepID=UPI003AD3B384
MRRETYKFLSGSFAALAYAHAAYAVAISTGVMTEPVFLGRRWSANYAWAEAVVYSAASVALAYAGWAAKTTGKQQNSVSPAGSRADTTVGTAAAQQSATGDGVSRLGAG